MYRAVALLRNSIQCMKLKLNTNSVLNRYISTSPVRCKWRTTSGDVERMLLHRDRLPETYRLIYRAPIESYVTWTKNTSTATVTFLALVASYQFATTLDFLGMFEKLELGNLVSEETDLYYFMAGFLLINLAIRAFVTKYPLRIYKSGDKYVAVFGSQLPVGTIKHHFERGQIGVYKNFLNPWSHIMYKLGNRSSMLLIDYFKTPSEFHQLFGEK